MRNNHLEHENSVVREALRLLTKVFIVLARSIGICPRLTSFTTKLPMYLKLLYS